MDKELNSLLESILLLLIQMLKGFIMGVWHGLRKALQNKWYLTGIGITLVFSVICITEEAMVCRMIPETIPEWLQQGIYLMLLAAPVIYLFLIGQTGQKNYDKCFEDIGFKGKNGKFPKYAGSSKEGKKILLFFQSTIPLSEWRSSRERLETALDCSIIKIENGRNKRTVKLTTLPSDYKIPTMVKWSEEYLNDKNGVLTLGISALDTISFNLNRVPHVLVAGETGSGKSVILRCLLWQMIEQGARVYMIDFKGGVEFGKQYEQYGEVITERERALQVLDLLVRENEYRLHVFRDLEVKNLDEYNKKTRQNLCRIGVFTDELAEMLDKKGVAKEEKQIYEQIEGKLSTLARLSRATGINLFMGVQRPDANVLTGQIKNNIPVRISGRFADKTASEIVLGNTDAVNLPDIKGRFLYKVGNETIEFQSFYFDDETMLHEVCVDQGEMLTEAPVYKVPEHKIPVRKNENKKAEVVRSGRKEKKVTAVKTSGEEKNSYEDPFVGMNSREIEEEMRRMDEEDLNLNFGDF